MHHFAYCAWYAVAIAEVFLVYRIWIDRLYVRHRWLFACALSYAMGTALLLLVPQGNRNPQYFKLWIAMEVARAATLLLAQWELTHELFEGRPRLRKFIANTGAAALSAAFIICVLLAPLHLKISDWTGRPLLMTIYFGKWISCIVTASATIIGWSVIRFVGLPASANARLLQVALCAFSASQAVGFVALSSSSNESGGAIGGTLDMIQAVSFGCMARWLSRSGEALPVVKAPKGRGVSTAEAQQIARAAWESFLLR